MVTEKELDRLFKTNALDKRAIDMLDNLKCAYSTYADFQMETLKVMEKLDAPDGTFGILCHLSAQSRRDAQDMYRLWYESVDFEYMSDDVYKAVSDAYYEVLSDNKF